MVESRKVSVFELIVNERKLMIAVMLLPLFTPYELARFCQLNRTCLYILQKIVNFKVLFEA